ncbi:hypothetical protein Clacol_008563 [Clathrus columnatus]|uniref:non-specific serine/threonine protein kinase n=1 Tax=Clathrus columnatus TaxID=1419009 RepID=A0AAV5AMF1_9AGAM|nr:hypothetical protein Clacol_008563 [Clathrus columnatus]
MEMTFSGSYADVSYNSDKCISEKILSPKQLVQESPTAKSDISRPAETKELEIQKRESSLSYCIGYGVNKCILGRGGYSMVFKGEDLNSGQIVAIKKFRFPLRVERPFLRHESRVLQLLQGHPAIPKLYGYGHLEHFEYISMEVLGASVEDKATKALTVITVIRIVEQTLSALKHVHKHGLVHRDIKPGNLICSIDPSKIMLIDFNIAGPMSSDPPKGYNPIKEKRHIMGTTGWASLNSHRGIDLGPGGDLESLAYTALFLLRGNLPWFDDNIDEYTLRGQIIVHKAKAAVSGSQLVLDFPADFAYFLNYSRRLDYHQMPDYDALEDRIRCLGKSLGGYSKDDPLDWTTVSSVKVEPQIAQSSSDREQDGVEYDESIGDNDSKVHTNSYHARDIDCWDDICTWLSGCQRHAAYRG